MSSSDIENRIKKLCNKIKDISEHELSESFIYDFMLAYEIPKATVSRIQKGGNVNLSNKEGTIILKNKFYFTEVKEGSNLLSIADDLKNEKTTHTHKPRFIIVTDYTNLVSIDTKLFDTLDIKVENLSKKYDFFLPLAKMEKSEKHDENPADRKAAEKMALLYDELIKNNDFETNEDKHNLNIFLSRLLFCFFADDTGIFDEDIFLDFINQHTEDDGSDLSEQLTRLFNHLNTKESDRPQSNPDWLNDFPYVNGSIFKDKPINIVFDYKSRKAILECARFDWKDINPDIFGSMIQAVVSSTQRGTLGMHYTSVPNIMKVINPLFLDEYKEILEKNKYDPDDVKGTKTLKKNNLAKLRKKTSEVRIFDPACGSGNFLIIAYKELSKLEMEILVAIDEYDADQKLLDLASQSNSTITLDQFYGIEIDDFAHEIAILSLFLAKHQMNIEFRDLFGHCNATLPLKDTGQIVCENALRYDWNDVCTRDKDIETYILGNPPYLGARIQEKSHKQDMDYTFSSFKKYRDLDYITCWFYKGANYIQGLNSKLAFVSTNSITQGQQVPLLWPEIFKLNIEIGFAHKSFKWTNNAKKNAGVVCVIIGLSNISNNTKLIFNNNISSDVKCINPYLIPLGNVVIKQTKKSISNLPRMRFGNMPNDGGGLILSKKERDNLINKNKELQKYIRPFAGSQEFINSNKRYCLWIEDEDIPLLENINYINDKINISKEHRLKSKDSGTKRLAERPHQFRDRHTAKALSLIIPSASSSRRKYIPIGFLDSEVIISNLALAIYDPPYYLFGVISSDMHMCWVRNFAGRLGNAYRYSAELCYNTFPFPDIDESQKKKIELAVNKILKQQDLNYELTLADLYDPDKMPEGLRNAHNDLDLVIDSCYQKQPFKDDNERLEYLFKLYEKMTSSK